MKKIVIINQDSGYLTIDIANSLVKEGFNVSIIAGRVIPRSNPLLDCIRVSKIIRYRRKSNLLRFITWFIAFIQILVLIKTKYRKDYLLIVSNPPFAVLIPLLSKNDFSLLIFDVYPDVLVQSGLFREHSVFIRGWRKLAVRVYMKAKSIFTLTPGMASILQPYCTDKELAILPLWSDNKFFRPIPKEKNKFISENNFSGKFIVLYSGNLGKTHNIEVLPAVASRIDDPDIQFLFIGGGEAEAWLKKEIQDKKLSNCILLPFVEASKMPLSFSSADLGIVTQGKGISMLSIPSKTYNYMASGLPLLCLGARDSELNNLITTYKNGGCFEPENLDEIAAFICKLKSDHILLSFYRNNSLKASLNFTEQNVNIIIRKLKNPDHFKKSV